MRAGVDVCRIGLAHGSIDTQLARIERIRAAAAVVGRPSPCSPTCPGPVRAAPFPDGGVFLSRRATSSSWRRATRASFADRI